MRSPLLFVEVMGVVEVMEVTLLFVEVTSVQKSNSLRVVPYSFFQPFIPNIAIYLKYLDVDKMREKSI